MVRALWSGRREPIPEGGENQAAAGSVSIRAGDAFADGHGGDIHIRVGDGSPSTSCFGSTLFRPNSWAKWSSSHLASCSYDSHLVGIPYSCPGIAVRPTTDPASGIPVSVMRHSDASPTCGIGHRQPCIPDIILSRNSVIGRPGSPLV